MEKFVNGINLDQLFDSVAPLLLPSQGFQESQLNQNAKRQVGAIGVMQVMPATGK